MLSIRWKNILKQKSNSFHFLTVNLISSHHLAAGYLRKHGETAQIILERDLSRPSSESLLQPESGFELELISEPAGPPLSEVMLESVAFSWVIISFTGKDYLNNAEFLDQISYLNQQLRAISRCPIFQLRMKTRSFSFSDARPVLAMPVLLQLRESWIWRRYCHRYYLNI